MNCAGVRHRLSAYLDGELCARERSAVARHLETCRPCSFEYRSLREALELVAELPRVAPPAPGAIVSAVMDRIELERRGPGLQLLFRSAWRARPLMLPSLLPAALVLGVVLSGALVLDRPVDAPSTLSAVLDDSWLAPSGTESNPLFPSTDVSVPRPRARISFPEPFLTSQGDENVFVETVVARDGSVSAVTLIAGESAEARELVNALRLERFEPVRLRGRPVAVSVYRLFSRMEVRARAT